MVDCHDNDSDTGHNATLEELVDNSSDSATVKDDSKSSNVKKKPDTLFLYSSALTASILTFGCGNFHVWLSPVLPTLRSNNTAINPVGRPITTLETSLLAGLPFLVGLAGSMFVGAIADIIGRKRTMAYTAITVLIFSLITAFSYDITTYIVARCGIFICYSAALVLVPIYLTEICEDHNRAKFGCLMGVSLPGGHLYSYLVGSVTNITVYTLLCAAPLVLLLIAFCRFAPESPVFLTAGGKVKSALKALEKLRRNKSPQEIEVDYEKLKEIHKSKRNTKKVSVASLLQSRETRKGLALALLPLWVQHFTGVTVIMQFMAPIFNEAGTFLSGNTISVLAGFIKMCMFFSTAMFVERTGRRRLLLISGYGTSLTLFFLGLFFYWRYTKWEYVNQVLWMPILCMLLNLLVYSIGLGPIPMAVMSELFANGARVVAVSILVTLNGILVFFLNFLFPIITAAFGVHCCIWIFSFSCCLGTTLIYFFLPETKGKSILEIQELLSK